LGADEGEMGDMKTDATVTLSLRPTPATAGIQRLIK
jgi:hypothetical protein